MTKIKIQKNSRLYRLAAFGKGDKFAPTDPCNVIATAISNLFCLGFGILTLATMMLLFCAISGRALYSLIHGFTAAGLPKGTMLLWMSYGFGSLVLILAISFVLVHIGAALGRKICSCFELA